MPHSESSCLHKSATLLIPSSVHPVLLLHLEGWRNRAIITSLNYTTPGISSKSTPTGGDQSVAIASCTNVLRAYESLAVLSQDYKNSGKVHPIGAVRIRPHKGTLSSRTKMKDCPKYYPKKESTSPSRSARVAIRKGSGCQHLLRERHRSYWYRRFLQQTSHRSW